MYTYKAKVVRVVDGDTIDALIDLGFDIHKKIRIRMVGMNAPESRTRDLEEKKRGLAAKARLKEILKEGKNKLKKTTLEKLTNTERKCAVFIFITKKRIPTLPSKINSSIILSPPSPPLPILFALMKKKFFLFVTLLAAALAVATTE